MSLDSIKVKLEDDEEERGCSVKREPELGPELLQAAGVAWPTAGTSAATCKPEFSFKGPSAKCLRVGTEVSPTTSNQGQPAIQGLKLESEFVKEEEGKKVEECGVSEAAALTVLYAGHVVKNEMVFDPELLQAQHIACSPPKGTSAATCKPELSLKGPSAKCLGSAVSPATYNRGQPAIQVLKLEPEFIEEEKGKKVEECGVSEAAARTGLYAGHAVKNEMLLGPKLLQAQHIACSPLKGSGDSESDEQPIVRRLATRAVRTYPAKRSRAVRNAGQGDTGRGMASEPERGCSVTEASTIAASHQEHVLDREPKAMRVQKEAITPEHEPGPSGVCPEKGINKQLNHNDALKLYILSDKERKLYSCDLCDEHFTLLSSLNIHKRIHAEEEYTCYICNIQFMDLNSFIKHKRNHTGGKHCVCDICNREFNDSDNLIRHKRNHIKKMPYRCEICSQWFVGLTSLINHKRIHTGEMSYTCDVCNTHFSNKRNLITHKRIHTRQKYICDICNKRFTQLSSLKRHKNTKNIHTEVKPFACDICDICFNRRSSLQQHKRVHSRIKPYTCEVCRTQFTQLSSFIKHKQSCHSNTMGASNLFQGRFFKIKWSAC